MNTINQKVYMIREGKYVMTVYNKQKIPHIIAFKNYRDAQKAKFETDTRNVLIHERITGHQLEIIKRRDVQFGKLYIDEVTNKLLEEYAHRPEKPVVALVEHLKEETPKHLLFNFDIVYPQDDCDPYDEWCEADVNDVM